MQFYQLPLEKLSLVSGDFETIGTYEKIIYVQGENLESPFVEVSELPTSLVDNQAFLSAKARKLEDLLLAYEDFVRTVVTAPHTEVLTWSIQEQQAQAYQKSKKEADAPLLKAFASARNVSLESLVSKVLLKASTYRTFIAHAIGQRQALQDAIERAQTKSALDSIFIHFTFPDKED